METKLLAVEALELKLDANRKAFAGYASVFNATDAYNDTIHPQAYDRTVQRKSGERPIRMRWNHHGPVIGKWTRIEPDSKGLYVEGELTPGHSVAEDVHALLKHGAVDGMSIGYLPRKAESLTDGRRLLTDIELIEISVVEEPADLGAKVNDVKDMIAAATTLAECERILRSAGGFSRADATAAVAKCVAFAKREAFDDADAEAAALLATFRRYAS